MYLLIGGEFQLLYLPYEVVFQANVVDRVDRVSVARSTVYMSTNVLKPLLLRNDQLLNQVGIYVLDKK
jgi:hypothetical protein